MKIKRVLLIEDDIIDQEFFVKALSKIRNGRLYGIANDGKEALTMLENNITPPDIIFMDCNMPVMNGSECLNEILQNPRTRNIPVYMLSSAVDQKDIFEQLGAKAFIKKTYDITLLRAKIDNIINDNLTLSYVETSYRSLETKDIKTQMKKRGN
ncbi:MAG: response regulator [Parafilimonas sp.]